MTSAPVVMTVMVIVMLLFFVIDHHAVDVNDDEDVILGVICDVEALSRRWRSPENCHDMLES